MEFIGLRSNPSCKELIQKIRAAKSAAEELSILLKESAAMRNSIKEDRPRNRKANVSKLLLLHLMGQPILYGHMECLKVAATADDIEAKRLGYLAVSLIVDENSPVAMLFTNSIQKDLLSNDIAALSLALSVLAAASTKLEAQEFSSSVERFFSHPSEVVRKKAFACAIRFVRQCPELTECFVPFLSSFSFREKSSYSLAICSLISEILSQEATLCSIWFKSVESLLLAIKLRAQSNIGDDLNSFLQCSLLRLFRKIVFLYRSLYPETEEMHGTDAAASVLSLLAVSFKGQNSVLYEVLESALLFAFIPEVLSVATSISHQFLASQNSILRCIAMRSFSRFPSVEAVDELDQSVVSCLSDSDPCVQLEAHNFLLQRMNPATFKPISREIVQFYLKVPLFQRSSVSIDRFIERLSVFASEDVCFFIGEVLKIFSIANSDFIKEDSEVADRCVDVAVKCLEKCPVPKTLVKEVFFKYAESLNSLLSSFCYALLYFHWIELGEPIAGILPALTCFVNRSVLATKYKLLCLKKFSAGDFYDRCLQVHSSNFELFERINFYRNISNLAVPLLSKNSFIDLQGCRVVFQEKIFRVFFKAENPNSQFSLVVFFTGDSGLFISDCRLAFCHPKGSSRCWSLDEEAIREPLARFGDFFEFCFTCSASEACPMLRISLSYTVSNEESDLLSEPVTQLPKETFFILNIIDQ